MDLESLMSAALVYGTSIDHTWSFVFTVIFAAVGFLVTMRQVFSPEHRSQRSYRRLVFWVQLGMFVFLANGAVALRDLFVRHNAILSTIQERARASGEDPALIDAFAPYAIMPEWLENCPADPPILCELNQPISVVIFVIGAIALVLLMPLIAGRERQTKE